MKFIPALCALAAVLFFSLRPSFADDDEPLHLKIKESGFVGLEAAQVIKGEDFSQGTEIDLNKKWQQRLLFQFVNDVTVSERIRVIIAVECQLNYSYPVNIAWPETQTSRFTFYPDRAEGTYSCGDPIAPFLQLGFGYFPFRTDPDVQNLGEFLFSSGTYPLYLNDNFNRPYARLLGLRATLNLFETLRQDFLLTSDYFLVPLQDWSFSYLASYTLAKCIDVGAGIMFAHCFPVDNKITTPSDLGSSTTYPYIAENGDTGFYSFKGTKIMARAAFDPKPLFPSFLSDAMGKKDLRLYGEVCIVGLSDYVNYDTTKYPYQFYNTMADRTLWMVGADIPAFKLLDVLALEFEYFPNRFPNSYQQVFNNSTPIPLDVTASGRSISPWKWSLYAKRTFLRNFALIGQIARDHFVFTNSNPKVQIKEDVLTRPGDMWWVLRLNANF